MTKITYALIAGILAVGAISTAFATGATDNLIGFSAVPTAGIEISNPIPDIKGSVDVGKNVLSSAKVGFAEAAALAESEIDGVVTSGNMHVQNGYLVYSFTVLSADEMQTILVDAGDGKVLHVSKPVKTDVSTMLLSSNQIFFSQAVMAPLEMTEGNFTFYQK